MKAQDFLTERDIKVSIPINITIPQDGGDPKISGADKEKSPGDDEEQKSSDGTFKGGSPSFKKEDDSPDAIAGKYSSLDDAFADLDSL